jgi:hypothetical protein
VSGKSGLYKVISKGSNTVIVESLIDRKKSPIHSHAKANMLEEIGIYTYEDTKSLSDIFDEIAKKEACKPTISHKSSMDELVNYFRKIVSNYDEERVYISDIKKVLQWYNAMQSAGLIELSKEKIEKTKQKSLKKKKNEK